MGGSGGSSNYSWTPAQTARQVEQLERSATNAQFQTQLADYLSELLSRYNNRDTGLVRERLEEINNVLQSILEEKADQIFGGSVAKRTYVDGLSDVDCLIILDGTGLHQDGPRSALETVTDALQNGLGDAEVSSGRLAVTVRYADGMEIQLLPAVRTEHGVKISSSRREDQWSRIEPKAFQQALTRRNQECGQQLVPTIKLAKAIIGQLPEAQQLSGYHIESLAIDAFRGYTGTKTVAAMLPQFFEKAKDRVLQPMTDKTGQSVHVDGYLGAANSAERAAAGHLLGRLSKRISNAMAANSLADWKTLFGED